MGEYMGEISTLSYVLGFCAPILGSREGRLRYSKGIMASAPQATVLQPLEVKRCKKEK